MKNESFLEREKRKLEKFGDFQLSNRFKKIGWTIFIFSVVVLFVRHFFEHPIWLKTVLRNVIIIGLIIVSLSKEIIEDEMIKDIRSTSYRIAFICGVLYAVIMPNISYFFEYLKNEKIATVDNYYFSIIFCMLLVQIMFFNVLKKII